MQFDRFALTKMSNGLGWYCDFYKNQFHTTFTIVEDGYHYNVVDPFNPLYEVIREWTFERAVNVAKSWAENKYKVNKSKEEQRRASQDAILFRKMRFSFERSDPL